MNGSSKQTTTEPMLKPPLIATTATLTDVPGVARKLESNQHQYVEKLITQIQEGAK